MSFEVRIHPAAAISMEEAHDWIAEKSEAAADRWFDGLQDAILSLSEFPARCGLAPESNQLKFELRQYIYGKRNGRYRVLFVIRDNVVHVLEVRHGARRAIGPRELRFPF